MFVFAIFSVGIIGLILSVGSSYNVTVDSKYSSIFDKYNQTQALYVSQSDIIQGGQVNPNGQYQAVYTNTVVASKQLQNSASLLGSFLYDLPALFSIPPAIVLMLVTLIFCLATFGFIYLISGRTP